MKRLYVLLALVGMMLFPRESTAQRYMPGQQAVQLTGGFVDGLMLKKDGATRFFGGVAFSKYNRNKTRWVFGSDFLYKEYNYKELHIPVAQFTWEAGYYVPFISNRGKDFFLSFGLTALTGYETSN